EDGIRDWSVTGVQTCALPISELAGMKRRGEKIVMVTAYDAPGARFADAAGIDLVLVGDSAAMVVLGHDSTVPASMDEMLILTRRSEERRVGKECRSMWSPYDG